MNKDRGYLQTITCNINLSSCRLRAESLARALNSKLWSTRGLNIEKQRTGIYDTYLTVDSENKGVSSSSSMANVVNQPPRIQLASFQGNLDNQIMIGHGWMNEMATEDNEELFDTPPCSSPPSPADDYEDIIVNPPTLSRDPLPFTTKFLRDVKHSDAFSDSSKLRERLRQYADGLLASADDTTETFYDASEDERAPEPNQVQSSEPLTDKSNFQNLRSDSICLVVNKTTDECHNEADKLNPKCSCFVENSYQDDSCAADPLFYMNDKTKVSAVDVPSDSLNSQSVLDDPDFSVSGTEKEQEQKLFKADNRHLQRVKELENEDRPMLLRTTSLKTGKTPPGTPSRKKIVRFADALGLDLEAVRHIVCDDLPNIPPSAYEDLQLPPEDKSFSIKPRQQSFNGGREFWNMASWFSGSSSTGLVPMFEMPASNPNFLSRVRANWVSLERITVADLSVHCVCCVLNVFYEKTIIARYTTDEWQNCDEVVASYVPFSSDGEFDKFSFSLFLQPSNRQSNERLCFAIRYKTKGVERWDNNNGQNYILRFQESDDNTTSSLLPTLEGGTTWLPHFY